MLGEEIRADGKAHPKGVRGGPFLGLRYPDGVERLVRFGGSEGAPRFLPDLDRVRDGAELLHEPFRPPPLLHPEDSLEILRRSLWGALPEGGPPGLRILRSQLGVEEEFGVDQQCSDMVRAYHCRPPLVGGSDARQASRASSKNTLTVMATRGISLYVCRCSLPG